MTGYYKRDVAAKKAEILAALPEAKIETWMDYGFRLDVVSPDGERYMTVMQPERPDPHYQPEINRPASEAIEFLRGGDAG